MSQYNGLELFEDIEDNELRHKNQAQVAYNIIQDAATDSSFGIKGIGEMIGYLRHLPSDDRVVVASMLSSRLEDQYV